MGSYLDRITFLGVYIDDGINFKALFGKTVKCLQLVDSLLFCLAASY